MLSSVHSAVKHYCNIIITSLHPLIENNITIELNHWLLSAYICNLFHTYHPYLEALSTWS